MRRKIPRARSVHSSHKFFKFKDSKTMHCGIKILDILLHGLVCTILTSAKYNCLTCMLRSPLPAPPLSILTPPNLDSMGILGPSADCLAIPRHTTSLSITRAGCSSVSVVESESEILSSSVSIDSSRSFCSSWWSKKKHKNFPYVFTYFYHG